MIRDLRDLAREAAPGAQSLGDLLTSLRKTDGLRFAAEFVFNSATAINGFDGFGHFLRAFLPINNCVDYEITPEGNCDSNFNRPATAATSIEDTRALFDYVLGDGGEEGGR